MKTAAQTSHRIVPSPVGPRPLCHQRLGGRHPAKMILVK